MTVEDTTGLLRSSRGVVCRRQRVRACTGSARLHSVFLARRTVTNLDGHDPDRTTRRARGPRHSAVRYPLSTVSTVLVLLAATACTAEPSSVRPGTGTTAAPASPTAVSSTSRPSANHSPAEQPTADQPTTEESDVPTIRITVAEHTFTAQLANSPTAEGLADQFLSS